MDVKDVILVYETGSQLWAITPKDKDYLVVVKDQAYEGPRIGQEGKDCFVMKESDFKKYLAGELADSYFNIVCSNKPIYGENHYAFDWFAVKDKVIEKCLRAYFLSPYISADGKHCHPHIAWALWIIYAIENNSTELTEDQKNVLRKAHDKQIDRKYQAEIREHLLALRGI